MYFKILIDRECISNLLGTSVLIGMHRLYQKCKLIINN